MTKTPTPREIAELYLDCWQRKDFEPLRPHLAEDVTFDGVFGSTRGVEDFLAGLAGMAAGTREVTLVRRLADDTDAMTWFDLVMGDAPATATVNWTHVEDGLVTAVRVTFDPREILAAG
ncbi:nuclear transport factor 2 family protein [Tsukamurella sp. 8F]|uniref:nuclear transport factor 2 family protein n=1 Tax=unclassified Tsukamurella TaxID=2633480 RepID=UPI0023B92705|nr:MULTISPECIES: nuclear transport factor 2 family protein [unclassified Tsukamurella]MDF0530999.1 nuclear transport factor 2 family protein [Tsukamurella sp. 8J]MDF0588700.1 nuclear transport factor 2 family protein [Tsukamurella sp. 8F]